MRVRWQKIHRSTCIGMTIATAFPLGRTLMLRIPATVSEVICRRKAASKDLLFWYSIQCKIHASLTAQKYTLTYTYLLTYIMRCVFVTAEVHSACIAMIACSQTVEFCWYQFHGHRAHASAPVAGSTTAASSGQAFAAEQSLCSQWSSGWPRRLSCARRVLFSLVAVRPANCPWRQNHVPSYKLHPRHRRHQHETTAVIHQMSPSTSTTAISQAVFRFQQFPLQCSLQYTDGLWLF